LHGARALRADEIGKFAEQGTFRRLLTKGEPATAMIITSVSEKAV
jgi:hypothetical protein